MIIEKLPKRLTAQRVYNHVKKHLLAQNVNCSTDKECKYRRKLRNGATLACAAGAWIPDDAYTRSMEGKSICDVILEYSPLAPLKPHIELLGDLQWVHDRFFPEDWPARLADVANEHKLKP